MSKKINVLQISEISWETEMTIPSSINWIHMRPEEIAPFVEEENRKKKANKLAKKNKEKPVESISFQGIIFTDRKLSDEILLLEKWAEAHAVFISDRVTEYSEEVASFFKQKLAKSFQREDRENLLYRFSKGLFAKQYGAKLGIKEILVSSELKTTVSYEGNRYLVLQDNFGDEYRQVANYRYNVPLEHDKFLDIYQEMIREDSLDVKIQIELFPAGSTFEVSKSWVFEGEEAEQPMLIDAEVDGNLAVSILARGSGKLKLGPLHYRFARDGLGEYIVGGERFVDQNNHELIYYFNPGDMKPPLNVYFSGYRTAEGFEGFFMMKRLGSPFILVTDPRNEGGSFYLGSDEYESAIANMIREKLAFLNFKSSDLILSGLSMGTFGALYYGAELQPHAIVVGKPLVNLGNMAKNETLNRPAGFGTSLDLLQSISSSQDQEAIDLLNQKFWKKFSEADFEQTELALAYMKNDDYDGDAFDDIIKSSRHKHLKIYGKGWLGRHNDNSPAIVKWFITQYHNIMNRDFGRNLK